MSEPNFFAELKRRNVYKVAVAYAVVAWLVIQAASILFPTFEMPPVAMKLLVFILAGGFIIALIVAWAFEMTPEGMKRTTEVSSDELRTLPYWSKRKFVAVIVTLALIAAALLAFQLIRARSNPRLEGGAPAMPNKAGLAGARPSISLTCRLTSAARRPASRLFRPPWLRLRAVYPTPRWRG
jgi:hypothetical protein